MNKYIVIIFLCLFFLRVDAQIYKPMQVSKGYRFDKIRDTTFKLPSICGHPLKRGVANQLIYDSCNSKLYFFNKSWIEIKNNMP